MSEEPPIPAHIWTRVLEFLAAGVNGQIVLHVNEGRVEKAEINEILRRTKGLSTTG